MVGASVRAIGRWHSAALSGVDGELLRSRRARHGPLETVEAGDGSEIGQSDFVARKYLGLSACVLVGDGRFRAANDLDRSDDQGKR